MLAWIDDGIGHPPTRSEEINGDGTTITMEHGASFKGPRVAGHVANQLDDLIGGDNACGIKDLLDGLRCDAEAVFDL